MCPRPSCPAARTGGMHAYLRTPRDLATASGSPPRCFLAEEKSVESPLAQAPEVRAKGSFLKLASFILFDNSGQFELTN